MPDTIGYRDHSALTQVLDRLFLGGFKNAEDLAVSNPHDITAVVNCTTEPLHLPKAVAPRDPSGFHVLQLNQLDGEAWDPTVVREAIAWMHGQIARGRPLLVHCHAGISRSPVLVAGYLYTCGFDFDWVLDWIKKIRPQVCPAPATYISMKRFFGLTPVAAQTEV